MREKWLHASNLHFLPVVLHCYSLLRPHFWACTADSRTKDLTLLTSLKIFLQCLIFVYILLRIFKQEWKYTSTKHIVLILNNFNVKYFYKTYFLFSKDVGWLISLKWFEWNHELPAKQIDTFLYFDQYLFHL